MTLRLKPRDDGYVDVKVSGIYDDTQQSETLDPDQAREVASDLEDIAAQLEEKDGR